MNEWYRFILSIIIFPIIVVFLTIFFGWYFLDEILLFFQSDSTFIGDLVQKILS